MPHSPLKGYVFVDAPHGAVDPGISRQHLGTFLLSHIALTPAHLSPPAPVIELGIPSHALYYEATIKEPFGRQGYIFEIVGTHATPADPPDAPHFTDCFMDNQPAIIIAWRRRVYCTKTPIYVEACWSPQNPETRVAIHGLEKDRRKESLLGHIWPALNLLEAVGGVRQPRPSMEEQAFWQTYYDSYQKVLTAKQLSRETGIRLPSKQEVATEMCIVPRTLRRLRNRYGMPWPPTPPP